MAGYCTSVLYFNSPAARENTAAHSYNIQPYCLLTHQIIHVYMYSPLHPCFYSNRWVLKGMCMYVYTLHTPMLHCVYLLFLMV